MPSAENSDSHNHENVFAVTQVSLLESMGSDVKETRLRCYERFDRIYRKPLEYYARFAKRLTKGRAQDLVQDFLVDKVFNDGKNPRLILAYLKAREAKPQLRFRSYLRAALRNFFIDAERAKNRSTLRIEDFDIPDGNQVEIEFTESCDEHVMREAIRIVQSENREDLWLILDSKLVRPAVHGAAPVSYAKLQDLTGLSYQQVRSRFCKGKRELRRAIERVVFEYVSVEVSRFDSIEAAVVEEMAALRQRLSRKKSLNVEYDDAIASRQFFYELLSSKEADQSDTELELTWSEVIQSPPERLFENRHTQERQKAKSKTTGEVWLAHDTPIEILDSIKQEAKSIGKDIQRQLSTRGSYIGYRYPLPIYHLLYLSCIASAKVHQDRSLTSQRSSSLLNNVRLALDYHWADDKTLQLLQRLHEILSA